ncbi:MAG: glycosyltransferase family 1 protein [Acidobacteriaceae bacterium]|nr:glycosyltransferase family 1 protein [Acidobacteriaceae bacterium]
MRNILVASTPAPGHVNPMLSAACYLRDAGYRIIFNTAEIFRRQVESENLRFVPFTGFANFDYNRLDEAFPERKNFEPGPPQLDHDFKHCFGQPIPDQYRGILQIMEGTNIDLVLTDVTFMGTFPFLLGPREARPPVIACGISPMLLSSIDTSPFSLPDSTPQGHLRNRQENEQFQAMFQSVQTYMNQILYDCGAPAMPRFFVDCWYTLPDLFLQFTAEAFEYPRSDMPANIRFAGPIRPRISGQFQRPEWWRELDGPRPVVLVTQGTIANEDLSQLIEPALAGLAGQDMLTVVATGRRDASGISASIPSNAIVEPFIPFNEIFPKVDVFVTNGGYGAVQQALSSGVPIVVAGTTEDKPFVAARVAWSGAGINLNTDRPSPEQVHNAVRDVLRRPEYRKRAKTLQANFARYDAFERITEAVAAAVAERRPPGPGDFDSRNTTFPSVPNSTTARAS